MTEENRFTHFIDRIRAGDESAATELVREYEPVIRREVRMQMRDRRLSRSMDSMDVSQSVLASFFVRAAAGQFDLDDPKQLTRLLITMARNKLASRVRGESRQRRDVRRTTSDSGVLRSIADTAPEPFESLQMTELLARFCEALQPEERQLADMRKDGHSWSAIAATVGGTAQSRRMQLSRAIDRVCQEMGLDEAAQ